MGSTPGYQEMKNIIVDAFKSFGYEASPEEINALVTTAAGKRGGTERGFGSVAAYVQTVRLQQERKKNDPLNQVIADERGFFSDVERKRFETEEKLGGPVQLFGGLDERQIDQYLSPLARSTRESSARLEGAANRRGISGSSTEFNALADNERRFRENTLATGLQVGLDERSRLLQMLGIYSGTSGASLGRQGAVAGQQSQMDFDDTRYRSELPIYLRGVSSQELAIEEAIIAREEAAKRAKRGGIGRLIGAGLGAAVGSFGGPMGAGVGANLGSQLGGAFAGDTSADIGAAGLSTAMMFAPPAAAARAPLFRGGGTYALPPTADAYATITG